MTICAAYPWLMLHFVAYHAGKTAHFWDAPALDSIGPNEVISAIDLPDRLITLVGLSTVATAWHQRITKGRRTRLSFALPGGRFIPYFGRVFIGLAIIALMERQLLPQPYGSPSIVEPGQDLMLALRILLNAVAIFAVSYMCLVLPAIAVGDRTVTAAASMMGTSRCGVSFGGGALLSVVPFYAAMVVLKRLVNEHLDPWSIGDLVAGLVPQLLFFACVAAGATYLSRAYLALAGTSVQFPWPEIRKPK